LREQSLVVETVQQIRARLPFAMLGLDVDNDSASETLQWNPVKNLPKAEFSPLQGEASGETSLLSHHDGIGRQSD
jgi:hypothetical protein